MNPLPPALLRPWMRILASFGRSLSPRDLLKFASRVAQLTRAGQAATGPSISSDSSSHISSHIRLSDTDREQILAEALDVFALHVPHGPVRGDMAVTFALVLGLGEDSAAAVVSRKPTILARAADGQSGGNVLSVGRASFQLGLGAGSAPAGDILPRSFAPTRSGLRAVEAVAVCVWMREPALLVGNTGVGKTTSVQVCGTVLWRILNLMCTCIRSRFSLGWWVRN